MIILCLSIRNMFDVCQVYHVGICIYRYQKPDVWKRRWCSGVMKDQDPWLLCCSTAWTAGTFQLGHALCDLAALSIFLPGCVCCPVVTIPCDKRNSYRENQWIGLTFTGHPQLFNIFHGENAWTCMVYCRCFPSINPLREGFWLKPRQVYQDVPCCNHGELASHVLWHITYLYIYCSIRQHNIT